MALLSLIAKLGLDKTGFDAGLKNAQKSVSQFGADLKGQLAGAFTVAAVGQFLKGIEETVGRIKDLSEQFGITTDEVQQTDFALKQSGLAFEDLGGAMARIAQSRREAVEGNEDLRQSFGKFGLTVEKLNNPALRTYDIFIQIAKAAGSMNMTAREQTELMDLLGNRAIKLVNVMKDLESAKPPAIFNEGDIERIDKMSKAFENLKTTIQAGVAPVLTAVIDNFRKGVDAVRNGDLIGAVSRLNPLSGAVNVAGDIGRQKAEDGIRGGFNEAAGATKNILNLLGGMFAGGGKDEGLFERDKNAKKIKEVAAKRSAGIESDAFGRIGAFTGAAAQSAQLDVARRQLTQMERLRDDLIRRGILVKGTD